MPDLKELPDQYELRRKNLSKAIAEWAEIGAKESEILAEVYFELDTIFPDPAATKGWEG